MRSGGIAHHQFRASVKLVDCATLVEYRGFPSKVLVVHLHVLLVLLALRSVDKKQGIIPS